MWCAGPCVDKKMTVPKIPTENSYTLMDFGLFSVKFLQNSYLSIDFSIFPAKISVNMAPGDG